MASRILTLCQLSLTCRCNNYLWRHPINNSATMSNRSSEVAKRHQLCGDNGIFKNRAQNIECSFGCVARSAILLKPNVANILLFNFCEHKFVPHGPITITIDCYSLSLLIIEEKWPNYDCGPKSAPNSDSFWVHRHFNVSVRVFCAPNATISLVYITAEIKMSFIWKDDFFFWQNRQNVTIFPSVVQAYTQPYSFGGSIKLIICQIRHELSVTIHQISFSWKKTLDGRPNTK